jgi:hypothetical protein
VIFTGLGAVSAAQMRDMIGKAQSVRLETNGFTKTDEWKEVKIGLRFIFNRSALLSSGHRGLFSGVKTTGA